MNFGFREGGMNDKWSFDGPELGWPSWNCDVFTLTYPDGMIEGRSGPSSDYGRGDYASCWQSFCQGCNCATGKLIRMETDRNKCLSVRPGLTGLIVFTVSSDRRTCSHP